MAENRRGPAGEDSGEPPPLLREQTMSDREYAAVDAVQSPGLDPLVNGLPAEVESDKLLKRDDAVLSGRKLRDLPVAMPGSCSVNLTSSSINLSGHVPSHPDQATGAP